jgi:hypothetical protein
MLVDRARQPLAAAGAAEQNAALGGSAADHVEYRSALLALQNGGARLARREFLLAAAQRRATSQREQADDER